MNLTIQNAAMALELAGRQVECGELSWEDYLALVTRLSCRMAAEANRIRLVAEAELLTGGTVEVPR